MRTNPLLAGVLVVAAALPIDSSAQPAGAGFTRVCHSGEAAATGACPALPAVGPGPTDWGCTRDSASGLLWEVKTAEPGPRHPDRTFSQFTTAYNPSRELGGVNDAAGYVSAVNAQRLCGAGDWRLPTRLELLGLVDYGGAPTAMAIAAAYFPNPPTKLRKSVFWSGSAAAGPGTNAWGIDFADGSTGDDNRSVNYALRLVSGATAPPQWTTSADGQEAMEARSKLVWRRCVEGMNWNGSTCTGTASTFTWAEATTRARAISAKDAVWRLPDVKELSSLVDEGRVNPSIEAARFPATPTLWFWTSTSDASDGAYVWFVNFGTGYTGHHGFRSDRHALRLVRSAP